jgi:hypothetical protein
MSIEKKWVVSCDNPDCDSAGEPWEEPKGRRTSHTPPEHWLSTEVVMVSDTDVFHVDVCSVECLSPAVTAKLKEMR